MPGLAIRLYLHRIEVIGDCLDTRLRSIGACAIAASAGGGRTKRAIAVTILDIPVVRALQLVRIFDLIDDPAFALPAATVMLCGGVNGLPLPSLNQIASPVASIMWLAPVPPSTD